MPHAFEPNPVIPILTLERAQDAVRVAEALLEGGLDSIMVTLRTPQALAAIEAVAREVPGIQVGAATVLRPADVTAARNAGAAFLVSPGLSQELAAAGISSGLPFLPGVATPSEIMVAWELGFSFLTIYPAQALGGTAYLKTLSLVFKGVQFCPVPDISEEELGLYLALTNVRSVGVTWIASPAAVAERDWDGIARRARRAAALGR